MQMVAGMVVAITRELGPLITAIVVIGRSGSTFAAEIGTMRVIEELDARQNHGARSRGISGCAEVPGNGGDVALPCYLRESNGGLGGSSLHSDEDLVACRILGRKFSFFLSWADV